MSILVDALEDAPSALDDYYIRRSSVPTRQLPHKKGMHSKEDIILVPLPGLESDPLDIVEGLPDLSEDIFSTSEEFMEPSEMPTTPFFEEGRDRRKGNRSRGMGSLEISRGSFDSIGMGSLGLPSLPRDSDLATNPPIDYELPANHIDLPTLPSFNLFASNVELQVHKCRICEQDLNSSSVFIHGFYYHSACLKCKKCESHLTMECASYKNDLYCTSCCDAKHGCRCGVCSCTIDPCDDRVRISRGRIIHRSCLVCYFCSCDLSPDKYELVEDQIMCQGCAAEARTRLCKVCNRIVLSDGVKRYGKWFHKEHFVCQICWKVLKGDLFVVHHGKFYCMEHGHVFRHSCEHCKGLIDDPEVPQVMWNRMLYHTECLICRVCGASLTPTTAKKFHNRPHCAECYRLRTMERERGSDCHKHNPVASASRRANFQEQGIVIVEPMYASRKDAPKMTSVKKRNANDGKEFEPSIDLDLLLP